MIRIIILFLIFIAVLAMIGKLGAFLRMAGLKRGEKAKLSTRRCKRCGALRPGNGPCACGAD
ncbi:MAG: hypothetical protein ACPGID_02015 [Rubricella sp.]